MAAVPADAASLSQSPLFASRGLVVVRKVLCRGEKFPAPSHRPALCWQITVMIGVPARTCSDYARKLTGVDTEDARQSPPVFHPIDRKRAFLSVYPGEGRICPHPWGLSCGKTSRIAGALPPTLEIGEVASAIWPPTRGEDAQLQRHPLRVPKRMPATRSRQTKNWPPLAEMVEPVMKPASSEARNTTQRAISSGSPSRPTGICGIMRSLSTFSSMALTISVPM